MAKTYYREDPTQEFEPVVMTVAPFGGVRYDTQQSLTEAQQQQARANIDVPSNTVVEQLINIWDEQWEVGSHDVTTGAKRADNERIRNVNFIPAKPNTDYYLTIANYAGNYCVVLFYDTNKDYLSYASPNATTHIFTTPNNCKYINFYASPLYGATYNHDISINYPSTYTGYYPSALPKEIAERKDEDYMITMDGFISPTINNIRNYWDGTLYHRRIARVDLGSLSWSKTSVFYASLTLPQNAHGYTVNFPVYNTSESQPSGDCIQLRNDNSIYFRFVSGSQYENMTREQFKVAMSGVFLYYELATEQTLNIDKNGLRYELLWTNASPTSDFAGQSITISSISQYNFIYVVCAYGSAIVATGQTVRITTSGSNKIRYRDVTLFSGGPVTFSDGMEISTYGSTTSTSNSVLIPRYIYGIR